MNTLHKSSRLARTWERIKREPGLGRNITVVVVMVMLASVTGGIILSNQRFNWPWEDRFVFFATLEKVPGVAPNQGQEVRIAGISVGDIRSSELDDHGKALVELAIDSDHKVYDNAKVVLRPKSPMNEMYIEFSPGGPPGKQIKADDVLPVGNSVRPIQVDEVLQHLDGNVQQALTSLLSESDVALAKAPDQLPEGLAATSGVARNLRPVAESLQTRKENLAKLVTSLRQIADAIGGDDERLSALADSLQRTLGSLGRKRNSVDSALAALPDVTGQLKRATDSVQGLSEQLDPTLDNLRQATDTLPDSLSRLTDTVDRVGRTVDVARPVVAKARPVVGDLRPFVGELNRALPELASITKQLDPVTGTLLNQLDDLGAFVLNTVSATSLTDGTSGILRAQFTFGPNSLPYDLMKSLSTSSPR